MKRSRVLALLLPALLLANSCAFFTRNSQQNAINAGFAAYVKANKSYEDDAVKYKAAHDVVRSVTLTAEQAADYQKVRSEVRAADNDVYSDLETWEVDGLEPPGFKAHRSALKAAQTRMILLSREVSGGGR